MSKTICTIASRFLAMPVSAFTIIVASLGALAFALIAQYGFNYQPCELCLTQRVPFGVAAAFAAIACIGKPYGTRARSLLWLCAVAFLVNTGIAIFHSGVELHWWVGTRGCHFEPLHGTKPEDWRAQILSAAAGHCDEISWTFLGLSMANWNIPLSFGLAMFSALAARFQGCKAKS